MKNNYNKILGNSLFKGISNNDLTSITTCFNSHEKEYHKNEIILHEGDYLNFIGVVIYGSVKILKTDYQGNEVIIAEILAGDTFSEVFACANISYSPVSIVSSTESLILFLDYKKIISTCNNSCVFHHTLISNMLNIIANKSLYLNRRIDIISKRTLRDKILTYFHYESCGSNKFSIFMNREELANFLCADRSALSNELSKMKKDKIIDYHKNEFILLDKKTPS